MLEFENFLSQSPQWPFLELPTKSRRQYVISSIQRQNPWNFQKDMKRPISIFEIIVLKQNSALMICIYWEHFLKRASLILYFVFACLNSIKTTVFENENWFSDSDTINYPTMMIRHISQEFLELFQLLNYHRMSNSTYILHMIIYVVDMNY